MVDDLEYEEPRPPLNTNNLNRIRSKQELQRLSVPS